MVYRLVYIDGADTLWVQYGRGNAKRRPHFLQEHHTTPDKCTVHPNIESALEGIRRFEEFDSSVRIRTQFAKTRNGDWTWVVDEDAVIAHIDEMISC